MAVDKQQAIKISSLIFALVIGGVATYYYMNRKVVRDLNPVMKELSIRVSKKFAEEMPRIQDLENVMVVAAVGGRDEDRRLKDIVVDAITEQRKYTIQTWDKLKEDLDENILMDIARRIGFGPTKEPRTIQQVSDTAKWLKRANLNLDGAILIDCHYDQGKRDDALGAEIRLTGKFFHLKTQKVLEDKTYTVGEKVDSVWNMLYITHKLDSYGFFSRFTVWVLLVLFQPWAFIQLNRMVLKQKKNELNMVLLGAYTFVDVAAAWPLLLICSPVGFGGIVILLAATGLTGYYNFDALDYTDRRLL